MLSESSNGFLCSICSYLWCLSMVLFKLSRISLQSYLRWARFCLILFARWIMFYCYFVSFLSQTLSSYLTFLLKIYSLLGYFSTFRPQLRSFVFQVQPSGKGLPAAQIYSPSMVCRGSSFLQSLMRLLLMLRQLSWVRGIRQLSVPCSEFSERSSCFRETSLGKFYRFLRSHLLMTRVQRLWQRIKQGLAGRGSILITMLAMTMLWVSSAEGYCWSSRPLIISVQFIYIQMSQQKNIACL